MTVYVIIDRPGDKIRRADGFPWINSSSVQESAMLSLHRAARNGWRGMVRAVAWTEEMAARNEAHAIVMEITDNSPEPRPADDRQTYASTQVGTPLNR